MSKTLSDDDRRAVDLLLDSESASGDENGGKALAAHGNGALQQRLEAVERILTLLDNMPAVDPPVDLTERVLNRLQRSAAGQAPIGPTVQPPQELHPHA